jgi:PAS domain S-box-containing protein
MVDLALDIRSSRRWLRGLLPVTALASLFLRATARSLGDVAPRATHRHTPRQHGDDHYRALVDGIKEYAMYAMDPDGRVQSWNKGAELIKGYRAEDVIGRHFAMFYTAEDRASDMPARNLNKTRMTGGHTGEGWRVRKDGSRFWSRVTIMPMTDAAGEIVGYANITRDLTNRTAEEGRTGSKEGERSSGILCVDAGGTIRLATPAISDMFGYALESLIGKRLDSLIPDARFNYQVVTGASGDKRRSARAGSGGKILVGLRSNGLDIPLEVRLRSAQWQDGPVTVVTIADLRVRQSEELDVRVSEARYRLLEEHTNDLIMLHDRKGIRSYVSPACKRMLGWTPEEFLAVPVAELLHPDDGPGVRHAYSTLSPDKPEFTVTHRLRHRNGDYIWVESLVSLVPNETAPGSSVVASIRDITKRHAAEAATVGMKDLLRDAIESMDEGVAVYDADDRLIMANSAIRRIAGDKPGIFTPGRSIEEILDAIKSGEDYAMDDDTFAAYKRHRLDVFRLADGVGEEQQLPNGRWLLVRDIRTREGGKMSITTDITPLKAALGQIEHQRTSPGPRIATAVG